MRILLDECIDRRLAKDLVGHKVRTIPQMGWAGSLDGALLPLVAVEFDVFLTVGSQFTVSAEFRGFGFGDRHFASAIESSR